MCVVQTVSERKRDMAEEIGDKLPPRPSDLQFVRDGIAPLEHALRWERRMKSTNVTILTIELLEF